MLPAVPDDELPLYGALKRTMESEWSAVGATPEKRWRQLRDSFAQLVTSIRDRSRSTGARATAISYANRHAIEKFIPALIFTFTYPRLDVNVSKQRNHLLKAPFCVHPKTGRVCVPIDVARVDEFDPTGVPTVAQLVEEGSTYQRSIAAAPAPAGEEDGDPGLRGAGGRVRDMWRHTSLKTAVNMFEAFVGGCEREARERMRAVNESAAAYTGDW